VPKNISYQSLTFGAKYRIDVKNILGIFGARFQTEYGANDIPASAFVVVAGVLLFCSSLEPLDVSASPSFLNISID